MSTQTLLNHYQQIDELTERMWHLAMQQQWESLQGLLADYQDLSQRLHSVGDIITIDLNQQQRQVVNHHLCRILSRQSQLSDMISLRQQTLSKKIGTTATQHKHINSYQQVATWF